MTQDDKTQLKQFLDALQDLLTDIVYQPRPAIPGRHHAIIQAAWTELSGKLGGVKAEIDSDNKGAEFDNHGLSGKQLTFKLALFWHANDELKDLGGAKDGIGKILRWWKRWFPACRRTLAAADVVLDSMAQVVIPLGALKEFKKGVECCVHRSEEEYHELPDTMVV